ncbi:alpha-amylase family protein [uncultured Jatrophihabitans sp.]|uniref:alpha-amylase family protein n=1 Tax=uncultured Jatrophihabitans sp. TaxID=1610747 RepID=UPI0035CB7D15
MGAPAFDALSPERGEQFDARVRRWLPDLRIGLRELYPAESAEALELRLLGIAAEAYARRPDDLHRLDLQRILAPDWFQAPSMLGYAAYAERFAGTPSTPGTLAGVRDQLPYLRELGVTYLHLMPLLQPREGDSDGGYAVADYRAVRADLGSTDDLVELADELRGNGISLVVDLVLNHVAREHAWARAARAGDPHYRAYFYVFPDRIEPDAFEASLPEVFPDFAPGNFTWDEELSGWVWTTFNNFQWDVNWANPDVFAEYADLVCWLANLGVEVLRLDAIAFLWKRKGTDSQNQPEVHSVARALRALTRIACPTVVLKAEAIVAPDALVQYLGQGRNYGKVSDLAYHNTLMVQIWSMLATRDVRLSVRALQRLPLSPSSTAWICYLRCHDDIGWAIDDADAQSVGLSGFGHRGFLSDYYTGRFPGSHAQGLTFQENPATGDRRVSGMTADLVGLRSARSAEQVDLGVRRALLAHAIVLGWGGIPVLWMGDELGLIGDADWAVDPGHAEDNRWYHRPWMDAELRAQRHDASTPAGRIFTGLRELAARRAELPMLHAATQSQVLDADDPGVLAVLRSHPEGDLLELFNVTESWRPVPSARLVELGLEHATDRLGPPGDRISVSPDGNFWLAPYQASWLVRP